MNQIACCLAHLLCRIIVQNKPLQLLALEYFRQKKETVQQRDLVLAARARSLPPPGASRLGSWFLLTWLLGFFSLLHGLEPACAHPLPLDVLVCSHVQRSLWRSGRSRVRWCTRTWASRCWK